MRGAHPLSYRSRVARLVRDLPLRHRAGLREEPQPVVLRAGEEVELLEEFDHLVLVRDAEGRLFNVPSDAVER